MPTIKELAGQELAQRYSRANSRQVAPRPQTMQNTRPTVRSALSNLMRDAVDATGLGGGYRQGLLNMTGDIESAVDFAPVIGDAIAVDEAAQSYGRGDMLGAGINMMGVVPVVGDVAAKGAKTARSALNNLLDPARTPEKVQTAYKLFRTDPEGNLYPLFVNANQKVPVGEWLPAEAGEMTGEKVKSKIGALAYRPGWHAGDLPIATHIGEKYDPQTLVKDKAMKAPNVRPDNQVWAEVEMPADYDWQTEAMNRAQRSKAGNVIPRTAHITDQVPYGGFYRYKTNPNMTGEWLIGGQMKVNRILGDDEVRAVNEAAGVSDLPRLSDLQGSALRGLGANPSAPAQSLYRADVVSSKSGGSPVAMKMNDKIAGDFDTAVNEYSRIKSTRGGKVINSDYARELSDDYKANKTLASDVQAPSSEFARALYQKNLADTQGQEGVWVFTGGGTASGKSAGLSGAAEDAADLVYDGTLKDFAKSDQMISEAADSGKKVKIVYVDRDPDKALPLYFDRANKEGRTVPIDVFLQSHRGARDSIRQLSDKYADDPRVDIQIWSNQGKQGEQKIIDVDQLSDFNVENVRPKLLRMLDEYYEQGKISEAIYNATKGSI